MGEAKKIRVEPITSQDAARVIKRLHYSGKVTQNSQLHFGVFYEGRCGGALSFGPSIDKRRMTGLVEGTGLNNFLELNRMALADWLPKNGESRVLGICLRLIKKRHPHVKWIVSFADATQCGDGMIYRAAGFILTSIKKNTTLLLMPDGSVVADKTLNDHHDANGRGMASVAREQGAKPLPGFQLRYLMFLDPSWRSRLTVPEIPYAEIAVRGASMYRGNKTCGEGADSGTPAFQVGGGGATPTSSLHTSGEGSDGS